jgi:hypothetical protein
MLQNKRQNFHHSKLPNIGEVVKVPEYICNRLSINPKHNKAIVVSFPLCENSRPYSIGIHTVNVMMLKDRSIKKISGFFFVDFEI